MNPTQDRPDSMDARAFQRITHDAAIMFSYYGSGRYAMGKMRNYSPCGCYFEADSKVPAGTDIFIKMVEAPSFWKDLGFSGGGRAQVVWCGEARGTRRGRYGIGVHIDWLGSALTNIMNDLAMA